MTYLVQTTPNVNRRLLHNTIDDLWKRGKEVGRVDLWVEEDFGREETLITNIHSIFLRRVVE